jgi:hypothetical protein
MTMPPDQFDKLLEALKVTAGSRFNAATRLENNDRNLTWVTAMTSAYIIALTIIPYFWKLPARATDSLNLVTVVLSVVTLVCALLHNSRRDAVNAEQHHRSALEINELRREMLVQGDSGDKEKLIDFSSRYNAILQKYSINHSELDYYKFISERPVEFPWFGRYSRLKIKMFLVVRDNTQAIIMLSITAFFLWMIFCYALPLRVTE